MLGVKKGLIFRINCFRMEDRGEVMSIKFSPDRKILAIQRSQKSVVGRVLQLSHYELVDEEQHLNKD